MADRLGRRVSTIIAGVLSATGALAIATIVDGWPSLVACMVVLGAANACCQLTANLAMARSIPARHRGLGFGVKQSAIPVAIVLAGLAVPTMTTELGWRSTFWVVGAAGACVVVVGLLSRASPRSSSTARRVEPDAPPTAALWVSLAAITLASAAANSLGSFVASWGFHVGLTPSRAGILMAVGSALNVVARLVAGHLADRRHGRNLPVVAAQMLVGGAALAVLSVPTEATFVAAAVVAFAVGWSWPGLLLFAVVRVGRDAPAKASGYVQAGAFIGGAAGPLAFGVGVDALGFRASWLLAAGSFFVAAALVMLARRMFIADLVARPPRTALGYGGGRREPRWTTGRGAATGAREEPRRGLSPGP